MHCVRRTWKSVTESKLSLWCNDLYDFHSRTVEHQKLSVSVLYGSEMILHPFTSFDVYQEGIQIQPSFMNPPPRCHGLKALASNPTFFSFFLLLTINFLPFPRSSKMICVRLRHCHHFCSFILYFLTTGNAQFTSIFLCIFFRSENPSRDHRLDQISPDLWDVCASCSYFLFYQYHEKYTLFFSHRFVNF